ncbi:hypothetical protein F0562_018308 [Nyssa sinensis]|uniref:Uncharacterized protein n=1 Tax=Nyssa sinensis TaxID=561372 RepID=A0A5J4ZB99_9ASTE|nr:hypothetical protein F0562_018308 [Nyssa sinensis]
MTSHRWNSSVSNFGSNHSGVFHPFPNNLGGIKGNWRNGSMTVLQSLVLDGERGLMLISRLFEALCPALKRWMRPHCLLKLSARPKLLSDLRQAIGALHLNMVKAEVSALGGLVKNLFVFTSSKETNGGDAEPCKHLVSSVHQALSSILDKVSLSPEYSPRTTLPNKRCRVSLFDSSMSSS